MHSDDNECELPHTVLVFPSVYAVQYGSSPKQGIGNMQTQILFPLTQPCIDTNTHTPSQTTQCLVQNGLIAGLITKETSIRQAPGRDRLAFSIEDPIKLPGSLFNEHRDRDGVTWKTRNERDNKKCLTATLQTTFETVKKRYLGTIWKQIGWRNVPLR